MKVLVGDSVWEEAQITVRDGTVYVEFEAENLDDISFSLADALGYERAGEQLRQYVEKRRADG